MAFHDALPALVLRWWALTGLDQDFDEPVRNSPVGAGIREIPLATGSGVAGAASGTWPVTDEERALIEAGLLPREYPMLKAVKDRDGREEAIRTARRARTGKAFHPDFGNPDRMLSWARENRGNAALVGFLKSIRKGDILLPGPGGDRPRRQDPICLLTRGPFHHALICVEAGPPPEFTGRRQGEEAPRSRVSPGSGSASRWEACP